jgi:hypothetical protein
VSGPFGTLFFGGWAFLQSSHLMLQIILTNSALAVVPLRRGVQFYRLFGLRVCGKFGKKEITGYSMAKNV